MQAPQTRPPGRVVARALQLLLLALIVQQTAQAAQAEPTSHSGDTSASSWKGKFAACPSVPSRSLVGPILPAAARSKPPSLLVGRGGFGARRCWQLVVDFLRRLALSGARAEPAGSRAPSTRAAQWQFSFDASIYYPLWLSSAARYRSARLVHLGASVGAAGRWGSEEPLWRLY